MIYESITKCRISKKKDLVSVGKFDGMSLTGIFPKNQNEKVFIFNGWTFSSNPSLAPIDHAIYDIWLVSCDNA